MKSIPFKIFLIACLSATALTPARGQRKSGKTAQRLEHDGYVNIGKSDKSIFVSLMYSRADNFTGSILYDDLKEAYLHPEAAKALVMAQARLKELRPDLSLKIYDAARPMHIQQKMWDKVKNTPQSIYVSNPAHGGGLHNYGLAVDLTLCTLQGDSIEMGTKIDHLGREAHIDIEDRLVAQGKISREARKNRRLLRQVMRHAGFRPLRTEWWHFNFKSREEAKRNYKVIK